MQKGSGGGGVKTVVVVDREGKLIGSEVQGQLVRVTGHGQQAGTHGIYGSFALSHNRTPHKSDR